MNPVAVDGLPPVTKWFTGRDRELRELADVLRPQEEVPGPVVLSGAGQAAVAGLAGVGKTALAVCAAHRAVRDGWFPGGVLFANLHGYDLQRRVMPAQLLPALLRSLGLRGAEIPPEADEQAGLFRSRLARRERTLLLLDNVFSVAQVDGLLPDTTTHRVLITSRHRLTGLDDARLLQVDVLDEATAVELVAGVLKIVDPYDFRADADPCAVAELTRSCGYLPLALRIVASRAIAEPERPLAYWVSQLSKPLDALDDGDSRAVRNVFDLSYDCLNTEQQRVFRLLSIHPGDEFSLDAAAALADLSTARVRWILAELRRAHLVMPGATPDYCKFHDLLRRYARERLEQEDRGRPFDAALTRLLDYYSTTCRQADGGAAAWLDQERLTLVGLMTLAADHHRHEFVLDLTQALRRSGRGEWIA